MEIQIIEKTFSKFVVYLEVEVNLPSEYFHIK